MSTVTTGSMNTERMTIFIIIISIFPDLQSDAILYQILRPKVNEPFVLRNLLSIVYREFVSREHENKCCI